MNLRTVGGCLWERVKEGGKGEENRYIQTSKIKKRTIKKNVGSMSSSIKMTVEN